VSPRAATTARFLLATLAAVAIVALALLISPTDPDSAAMATMVLYPETVPPAPAEAGSTVKKSFSILACGDILLARTPGIREAQNGFRFLFEDVRELVSSADIAFANLETPASYLGVPYPGKPPNVTFRADPATLFGVAWAGFDVLSIANNHMNDYGPRAVGETLDFLDLLSIERCGAGRDLEEARRPAVLWRDGASFAFLAYAEPIWSVIGADGSLAGRALTRAEVRLHGPLPPRETPTNPDSPWNPGAGVAIATRKDIISDIQRIKTTINPDYLFVSIHWGDEHQHVPNAFQRSLGHAAIDAGATAVLGHHPHVLQSLERYAGGLIIYSLGNFVFDMAADHTYETAALRLVVSDGSIDRVDIQPLRIARGQYKPAPVSGADARFRLADLSRWSARLGTGIVVEGSIGHVFF